MRIPTCPFEGRDNSTHNNYGREFGLYGIGKGESWQAFDLGHYQRYTSKRFTWPCVQMRGENRIDMRGSRRGPAGRWPQPMPT